MTRLSSLLARRNTLLFALGGVAIALWSSGCQLAYDPDEVTLEDATTDSETDAEGDARADTAAPCSPACESGECCEGQCVETASSADHCGGCGIACDGPRVETGTCDAGECSIQCVDGFADCNGDLDDGCEAELVTTENCGACGNTCSTTNTAGVACESGACAVECSPGFADCDRDASNGCETSFADPANCGECGASCPTGDNVDAATCVDATCGIRCDAGFADCDSDPENGCELDTRDDDENCGACGNACPDGSTCTAGACDVSCGDGEKFCFGECVPTDTVDNCGDCGVTCTSSTGTPACEDGACTIACTQGTGNCNDDATDGCEITTADNPNHCGGCGVTCDEGELCCGVGCAEVASDDENCGACGVACAEGESCCGGSCQTTENDILNCGGCGVQCGQNEACCNSACVGSDSSDIMNCGGCGVVCGDQNAAPTCNQGICELACEETFGDCDEEAENGCETLLLDSADHCGACGNSCAAGADCVEGQCLCGGEGEVCADNQGRCTGANECACGLGDGCAPNETCGLGLCL